MEHAEEHNEERVDSRIGGIPISIRGLNMLVFLSLVAVTSFTIYYLSVIVSKEHLSISASIDLQTKALEEQTKALKEQNYILLADDAETKMLKHAYRMPQSLREKLNGVQP